MRWLVALVVAFAVAAPVGVFAQEIALAGSAGISARRFDSVEPDRLSGTVPSWLIGGGVKAGRLVIRAELSWDAPLTSADTTSVVLNGQTLAIRSTLESSQRAVSALGGYSHPLSPSVRLDGVAGVSFAHATRRFSTNAASQLLPPPSNVTDMVVESDDDTIGWIAGADVRFARARRFSVLVSLRVQPLHLDVDLDGMATRVLGGIEWKLR